MANKEGLQIDLDSGEGLVVSGHITDQISNPCTMLQLEFHCKEMLVFHPDENYYFRYLSLEWIPLTCNFGHTSENTWWYRVEAIPKQMFKFIEKPCPDMDTLAEIMNLELGKGSTNFPIKCPVVGLTAYAFIRTIRLQSFNDAAINRQLGEAQFIYCNSKSLTALSWETMTKSEANSLEIPDELKGTEQITVYDSRIENNLMLPAYPKEWTEEDWLRKINGFTFEFKTLQPALFAEMYTIKFNNNSQMDSPESMLCFYTDCDLMNLNMMTNRFAQIQFE